MLSTFLIDGPEYARRANTPFIPPNITLAELHAALPPHVFKKSTARGLSYVARDVVCALILYRLSSFIPLAPAVLRFPLWAAYWWCQGIVLAGWWCLAHEAGHGTISEHSWVNHAVGFTLHTAILAPYYAWRETHRSHHRAPMSVERDENYVPRSRSEYGLWPQSQDDRSGAPGLLADGERKSGLDPHEVFEDAPIYVLSKMLIMQLLGWQIYLFTNEMGNQSYPKGTNHFDPSSPLFKPRHRRNIIISDIGICVTILLLTLWAREIGFSQFVKVYGVPYLLANHWIVMLTYLHHSDPTIPYYRSAAWNFVRGAASTVDRPLLGWVGRVFFHNVSHDHVAHHLFSYIPFYNQPEVTKHIRILLGENYNYDSTNTFRALYRTFTQCCFIEDEGEIVFYKNRDGKAVRRVLADGEMKVGQAPMKMAM
ncbi:delta-12 fatty acid desaturase [Armillaria novae-zelandiae]|uniref:Delta-12 fatty acid desaturase n=1 Tax=Armillaria novae-zelandiae TaxID=153914 RepID=A0AA39P747_9AGAR|nr:delta-12 fatty acid desaturase [Armillaria novae-zelandiae]